MERAETTGVDFGFPGPSLVEVPHKVDSSRYKDTSIPTTEFGGSVMLVVRTEGLTKVCELTVVDLTSPSTQTSTTKSQRRNTPLYQRL